MGRQIKKDPLNAHETRFLHPVLRYYGAGKSKPKTTHHMLDDTYTVWHAPQHISPLIRFVASSVSKATGVAAHECWDRFADDASGDFDEEWPPIVDRLPEEDPDESGIAELVDVKPPSSGRLSEL